MAFALYLLFLISWFLHLTARWPVLGTVRADLLLVCIIGALTLLQRTPDSHRPPSRIHGPILALLAYVVVTLPLVEWPGTVLNSGVPNLVKALVFYFFTRALVTSEQRLRVLLHVFLACQTFRVLEPLYLHVTEGYWGSAASMANWEAMDRLSGAPSDVINPNGLAYVILTCLAFAHYLWPRSVWGAIVYATTAPLLMWALILTGSRSGLIGLAGVVVMMWWFSRRKPLFIAVMTVAVMAVIPRLTPDQLDRYTSIWRSDAKNAVTAQGRSDAILGDFRVALRRPLFGHGLGSSPEANANFGHGPQRSHNLYTEVLQELGFAGLGLFLWLLWSVYRNAQSSLRLLSQMQARPGFLARVGRATQVFMFMSILFSFFSYGLASYEWYFLAGLSHVTGLLAARTEPSASRCRPGELPVGAIRSRGSSVATPGGRFRNAHFRSNA